MEIASKIIALIVSGIGAIVTLYETFFMRERKRKLSYYNSLLKPFILEYKKNPKINAIEFVNETVDFVNDDIPKYIFYLANTQMKKAQHIPEESPQTNYDDNLKKVLITDYLDLYPNENNKKCDFFKMIRRLVNYILILLSFFCIFMGALIISSQFLSLVSCLIENADNLFNNLISNAKLVLLGVLIILFGAVPVLLTEYLSYDMYTVKKKQIEKIISERIDRYDERISKYIF